MAQEGEKNTTGHVWDDDLQEYTNPLPQWWLWAFYITIIFSVVYWLLYPAWPVGDSYTKGLPGVNTITYTATTVDGQKVEKETHWNMRSLLMAEMNEAQAAQKPWFDKVAATPFEQIAADAELMQFVNSAGRTLFADNCAACHLAGGEGKLGLAPGLIDDDWMFGGTHEAIHQSIASGRNGQMPAFKGMLSDEKIGQVAHYVLSLSGEPHDAAAATAGQAIYNGEGICMTCHGTDGKGNQMLGAANLTDRIWVWADVPGRQDAAGKIAEISRIVAEGMNRGVMPAWSGRLTAEQVKLLTVYVHDTLGGGQ